MNDARSNRFNVYSTTRFVELSRRGEREDSSGALNCARQSRRRWRRRRETRQNWRDARDALSHTGLCPQLNVSHIRIMSSSFVFCFCYVSEGFAFGLPSIMFDLVVHRIRSKYHLRRCPTVHEAGFDMVAFQTRCSHDRRRTFESHNWGDWAAV